MFNSQYFQSWTFQIAAIGFAKLNSNPSVCRKMAGGFSALIICFISTSLSAQWVTEPITGRAIPVQSASYNSPLNGQPSISLANYASTPTLVTSALPNSTYVTRDFAHLVERARKELNVASLPKIDIAKARLQSAMSSLERYLNPAGSDNGLKWLTFLKWEQLSQELAKENPDLEKLIDVQLAMKQNYFGLEYGPFTQVRDALTELIHAYRFGANPESTLQILDKRLEKLSETLQMPVEGADSERTREIGLVLGYLHDSHQTPWLVSAIRSAFVQPNVQLLVRESFVNRMLSRPVAQPSPVDECILGTHVLGNACLVGNVTGDLVPSASGVCLFINLGAQFSSNNVGYNRGVKLYSTGAANVQASKLITISPSGVSSQPTMASAPLSSNIHAIEHRLRIVRRIAKKKSAKLQPTANAIGQGRLERRLSTQFDAQVEQQLAEADSRIHAFDQNPPELRRLGLAKPSYTVYSSSHAVHANLTESSPFQLAAAKSCALPQPSSDILFQAHQSVISNITDHVLGGRTIYSYDLDDYSQQLLGKVPAEVKKEADGEAWSITLATYRPFEVELDNRLIKVTVRATNFKRGDRALNQPTTIVARYLPVIGGGLSRLERQGDVEILFNEGGVRNVTLRAFMKTKLEKILVDKTKDQSLALKERFPKLPNLSIEQIAIDDGWVQVGLR